MYVGTVRTASRQRGPMTIDQAMTTSAGTQTPAGDTSLIRRHCWSDWLSVVVIARVMLLSRRRPPGRTCRRYELDDDSNGSQIGHAKHLDDADDCEGPRDMDETAGPEPESRGQEFTGSKLAIRHPKLRGGG